LTPQFLVVSLNCRDEFPQTVDKDAPELGCLKWLLAVDRFLDSRGQSRLSSAWWRSIFKEQGVIQARQLRAMEIFVSI